MRHEAREGGNRVEGFVRLQMSKKCSQFSVTGGRSPFAAVGGTDFGGGGGASVAMVDAMVETGDAASTSSEYFIASSKVGS